MRGLKEEPVGEPRDIKTLHDSRAARKDCLDDSLFQNICPAWSRMGRVLT